MRDVFDFEVWGAPASPPSALFRPFTRLSNWAHRGCGRPYSPCPMCIIGKGVRKPFFGPPSDLSPPEII